MANFNFNKVILGGRLTADPELRQSANGIPVTTFSLAVNRKKDGEQKADFHSITAWRAQAELICRFFKKGSGICIVGSLQNRSWTDSEGTKRYVTDIVADEVYFVDSKSDASAPMNYTSEAYQTPQTPDFSVMADDEDLPF